MDRKREVWEKEELGETDTALGGGPFKRVVVVARAGEDLADSQETEQPQQKAGSAFPSLGPHVTGTLVYPSPVTVPDRERFLS